MIYVCTCNVWLLCQKGSYMDNVLRMDGRYLNEQRISSFLGEDKHIKVFDAYSKPKTGTLIGLNNVTLTLKVQEGCIEIPLLEITRIEKI